MKVTITLEDVEGRDQPVVTVSTESLDGNSNAWEMALRMLMEATYFPECPLNQPEQLELPI
jgi:hypothetical protein